jgi:hypothetical protein
MAHIVLVQACQPLLSMPARRAQNLLTPGPSRKTIRSKLPCCLNLEKLRSVHIVKVLRLATAVFQILATEWVFSQFLQV